ncbi:MAG: cysteine--tRNA ligase [Bdellovibrio sp.]|nr:MAG: cysteine--tRNA ligase [Bdellovibrio sp.]
MSLMIFNSMSQKKEKFEPLQPPQVKIYACGPTVYDLLHVGNFRGYIFFHFVRQWLSHQGYQVVFHCNFTDVEDKIIDRARREGIEAHEVARKYIIEYQKDYDRLGLRRADRNPTVTESMDAIIAMIKNLVDLKKAYQAGEDVNYSIRSFPSYGRLSHRNPDDMLTAVRIERDDKKKDPLDFVLWKGAKPGEPFWDSPWGKGRPGWHIECSAMIYKHLGETIDIHTGGMDLIFPHHENEIAQSEGSSGKPFVKYWMHWNMVNFGGAKMSKSVGNVTHGRDFMDEYGAEVLKFMVFVVHYRSTLDLSPEAVHQAIASLARIYSALALAEEVSDSSSLQSSPPTTSVPGAAVGASTATLAATPAAAAEFAKLCEQAWKQSVAAFNDDFNTAEAMAHLFGLVRHFNTRVKRGVPCKPEHVATALEFKNFVGRIGQLTSLFQQPAKTFLRELDDHLLGKLALSRAKIDEMVKERMEARRLKDYRRSDEIRDALVRMGISVADTRDGSFWEVTK